MFVKLFYLFIFLLTSKVAANDNGLIQISDVQRFAIQIQNSHNQTVRRQVFTNVRALLCSTKNPPINQILNSGILPNLLDVQSDDSTIQNEATRSLICILNKNSQLHSLVTEDTIPRFIQLLYSDNTNSAERTVSALNDIVGSDHKNVCIESGLLDALSQLVKEDTPKSLLRKITRLLSKLFRPKEMPPLQAIETVLPALNQLIGNKDDSISYRALNMMFYITNNGYGHIQLVVDSGSVNVLANLLDDKVIKIAKTALRVLNNIATGTSSQIQQIVDGGALNHIKSLWDFDESIRKNILIFLLNIASGNDNQFQALVNADLLPTLLQSLTVADNIKIEQKSVSTLYHLTRKEEQVKQLIDNNVVKILCQVLERENYENGTRDVLQIFTNLLNKVPKMRHAVLRQIIKNNCFESIKQLQYSENVHTSLLATHFFTDKLLVSRLKSNNPAFYWTCLAFEHIESIVYRVVGYAGGIYLTILCFNYWVFKKY